MVQVLDAYRFASLLAKSADYSLREMGWAALADADLAKVGPKGYEHGWIKVGPGVVGDIVHHPEHGHGRVTRAGTATTGVTFDSGHYAAFGHKPHEGEAGHFVERPAKPARKAPAKAATKPKTSAKPAEPSAGAEAIPVRAVVTGESSDPSTWKTTGFEGTTKAPSGAATAVTAYIRRPGDLNRRLRNPDKRVSDPTFGELMGRESMDAGREAKAAAKADRQVAGMDKVMAVSRTTAPLTVYRGASGARYAGLSVGDTFTDPGFVSTALDRKVAEHSFAGEGRVLLAVHAPAGTHALHIGGLGESEVLLDRGQTFRVVADHGRTRGGARHLEVEIVPKGASRGRKA